MEVTVCGAAGRMGRRMVNLLTQDEELRLSGAIEAPENPLLGRDAGEVAGVGSLNVPIRDSLEVAEGVVVDFTTPGAALDHLEFCVEKDLPMVMGTTGFSSQQEEMVKELAPQIPCLVSPNMSVGVNILFGIIEKVSRLLGSGWDVEVVEAHHRFKGDSPSGTAKRLAEIVASQTGGRPTQGRKGKRGEGEIGVHSVRAGDIVGEHTVIFGGLGERLEFTHRVHSRDCFARGAIIAVKFVAKAPKGLYTMADVLKL